jgi:hypothetical protein
MNNNATAFASHNVIMLYRGVTLVAYLHPSLAILFEFVPTDQTARFFLDPEGTLQTITYRIVQKCRRCSASTDNSAFAVLINDVSRKGSRARVNGHNGKTLVLSQNIRQKQWG